MKKTKHTGVCRQYVLVNAQAGLIRCNQIGSELEVPLAGGGGCWETFPLALQQVGSACSISKNCKFATLNQKLLCENIVWLLATLCSVSTNACLWWAHWHAARAGECLGSANQSPDQNPFFLQSVSLAKCEKKYLQNFLNNEKKKKNFVWVCQLVRVKSETELNLLIGNWLITLAYWTWSTLIVLQGAGSSLCRKRWWEVDEEPAKYLTTYIWRGLSVSRVDSISRELTVSGCAPSFISLASVAGGKERWRNAQREMEGGK